MSRERIVFQDSRSKLALQLLDGHNDRPALRILPPTTNFMYLGRGPDRRAIERMIESLQRLLAIHEKRA